MGLFDRMEQRIERAVNGAFARAFRAEVAPMEIASAVHRAMDDRAIAQQTGRSIVPNLFTIELSDNDYARLSEGEADLQDELIAAAQEHADSQRYHPGGPLRIHLKRDSGLETGVFRVRPATARRPDAGVSHEPDPYAGPPARSARSAPSAPSPAYAPQQAAAQYGDPAPHTHGEHVGSRRDEVEYPAGPQPRHQPAAPAPAPRRAVNPADRPWLDIDGDRYPLMGAITVLGRDEVADIILDDPGISRRHSELRLSHDGPHLVATLQDLGSTNGTFVNSERITSTHLSTGDRITVGRTAMTYRGGKA